MMNKKNENDLKKCRVCGKTITDENNKSRLCPDHQGKAETICGGVALTILTAVVGILSKVLRKR